LTSIGARQQQTGRQATLVAKFQPLCCISQ
jgi:hypothetical protein